MGKSKTTADWNVESASSPHLVRDWERRQLNLSIELETRGRRDLERQLSIDQADLQTVSHLPREKRRGTEYVRLPQFYQGLGDCPVRFA